MKISWICILESQGESMKDCIVILFIARQTQITTCIKSNCIGLRKIVQLVTTIHVIVISSVKLSRIIRAASPFVMKKEA